MVAASSTQAVVVVVVVVVVGAVAGSRRCRVGVGCRRCHLVDNAGGGHCWGLGVIVIVVIVVVGDCCAIDAGGGGGCHCHLVTGVFMVGQSSLSGHDDDVHGGTVAATQVVGLSLGPDDAGGGMVAASLMQAVVVVVVMVSAIAGSCWRWLSSLSLPSSMVGLSSSSLMVALTSTMLVVVVMMAVDKACSEVLENIDS